MEKLDFLLHQFPTQLRQIDADAKGNWGLLNGQQMVEHFILAVKSASGKLPQPLLTPAEQLDKLRSFLYSDKPFKENTKNPLLGDPLPKHYPSMEEAIAKLEKELNYFAETFRQNPSLTTINPFFGELDFAGNVQLLHKHAVHHLRQFGICSLPTFAS